jgi:hypothetical protein
MSSLAQRAEQAVLGALLHDHDLIGQIPHLAAEDFAEPTHQAVFLAVSDVHLTHPAAAGNRFTALVAASIPAIDGSYLHRLPDMCPYPAHLAAYARMVTEAALIRELGTHADRIAHGAADLVRHADRLRLSGGVTARERAFPDHLAKLAQAMKQHANRLNPDRAISAETERQPSAGGWPGDPQARRETQVLADLIQHPDECQQVMGWLPTQVFTPGPHREIYEAMRAVVRAGNPVDSLTVAWQLAVRHASAGVTGFGQAPGFQRDQTEANPDYAFHLANLPVEPGSAIINGGLRLADHISAELTRDPRLATGESARGRPGNRRHPPQIPDHQASGAEARPLTPPAPVRRAIPGQDGHDPEPPLQ